MKKIYVLDTSVIIYDHEAVKHFEENDVAIPIAVLEELDNFKKGNDTKNYSAREFIRFVDQISTEHSLQDWVPLNGPKRGKFRVILDGDTFGGDAVRIFEEGKPDHRILNAALQLQREAPKAKVVLVTKDVSLRIKAKSLKLHAEDYETGKIKDLKNLYTGEETREEVDDSIIDRLHEKGQMEPTDAGIDHPIANHYYTLKNSRKSVLAWYDPNAQMVRKVEKQQIYGINPRNAEQTYAIHALMNPEVKLVTLQGTAGTGKTLLAIASAIEQRRDFKQIYIARPVVPLSNRDLGFLPGDIKDKLNPYMEPLYDNLKFVKNQFDERDKQYKQIDELMKNEKIAIIPLAYIRGRSLSSVIFIVDESQNLTPHEVKTIITRAGENTKIIFTGDIHQIDTPYLDAQSNGLSYLIDRLQGNPLFAHVNLVKGERSPLANLASQLL